VWQRVAVRQGRQYLKHGRTFVEHVGPAIVKPARTLWNEVIGFIFFCLAVPFGVRAYSFFRHEDGRWIPVLAVGAFLMCFAVSSFRKARKISRS
jgi:hypothetical protein